MKRKYPNRWTLLITIILLSFTGYFILTRFFLEESKQVLTQLRENVKEEFPDAAKRVEARYGLRQYAGERREDGRAAGTVILVHGLDDPGKVWTNLQPVLLENGFHVWAFEYPDDQPISESAQFFMNQMRTLKKRNVGTVSIVAHSMGGLVAREMLTNPGLSYADAVSNGMVPAVAQLIMVATPNHGSELAQFRILGEFRDQLANIMKEDYVWIEGLLDGAGEAGMDLVPGSPFLKDLNSRPHPESLDMVVIAGVLDATAGDRINKYVDRLSAALPEEAHGTVAALGDILASMVNEVGDGLVPVESAKLNGYPFHIVPGTHLSIIRNIRAGSERVPPAIPIILQYLNKPVSAGG